MTVQCCWQHVKHKTPGAATCGHYMKKWLCGLDPARAMGFWGVKQAAHALGECDLRARTHTHPFAGFPSPLGTRQRLHCTSKVAPGTLWCWAGAGCAIECALVRTECLDLLRKRYAAVTLLVCYTVYSTRCHARCSKRSPLVSIRLTVAKEAGSL